MCFDQHSMYGENVEKSGHARIVSVENAKRLVEGIKEAEQIDSTEIIYGGSQGCNVEKKFVTPTVVLFNSSDHKCALLQNEIFGPILPVIPVKEACEAIQIINQKVRLLLFRSHSVSLKTNIIM